jgi:RHS repeat-associated protein
MIGESRDGTIYAMYHWHPFYVDALAARIRDGDIHFFLQDANFNVTAVVENDGDVVERYQYSPYGQVTFLDDEFDPIGTSAIGNTHLYTGRERDPETGLQLNRNRFYAAHLGRWVNRDPIGYRGGNESVPVCSRTPDESIRSLRSSRPGCPTKFAGRTGWNAFRTRVSDRSFWTWIDKRIVLSWPIRQ